MNPIGTLAAATLLICLPAVAEAKPDTAARPEVVFQDGIRVAAEKLIPSYAGKGEDRDLATLFQLQLATGRYAEADATVDRLIRLRTKTDVKRGQRLLPWRVYTRAKAAEAQHPVDLQKAFERSFTEMFGSLDDKSAVAIMPWFAVNAAAARKQLSEARAACPIPAACPSPERLVLASVFFDVWSFATPASEPLLKADMARRFIVEDRLLIPAHDGAQIAAMIVRPRSTRAVTSLMNFTIYTYDDDFNSAAKMAANGYAGIIAYSRGKAWSPGAAIPYEHDGADAAAVIDWIARQSWGDGRVGMYSGSYNASTQWAALKHMPPALKAIATHASNAPGIDTPMERNIFANFIYKWPLYTTTTKGLDEALNGDSRRWAALNRNWYLSGRPYRDLADIDGTPNPVFTRWLSHPSYDGYWQRLVPFAKEFARINIPVLVQTGYFDGGMVGALYYWREHHKYNRRADHRLLIGPYHHTAMEGGVLNDLSGYEIDPIARVDLQDIRLRWFDHVFRGAPLPQLLNNKINFEVMGANRWRHVPSIEAMGNRKMNLYLSDESRDGRLTLAPQKPSKRGFAVLSVDLRYRGDVDYELPSELVSAKLDARNALVFATAPFAAPFEINGTFRGLLNLVANKRDLDLSVAIYEQLPDGRYFPLANFIGRASYLDSRIKRRLLAPARLQTLRFESDRMTSRRIEAGSRIVATVGVLKQPDYQINYGTGKDVSDESIKDAGEPLSIRFFNDSRLELRVWR